MSAKESAKHDAISSSSFRNNNNNNNMGAISFAGTVIAPRVHALQAELLKSNKKHASVSKAQKDDDDDDDDDDDTNGNKDEGDAEEGNTTRLDKANKAGGKGGAAKTTSKMRLTNDSLVYLDELSNTMLVNLCNTVIALCRRRQGVQITQSDIYAACSLLFEPEFAQGLCSHAETIRKLTSSLKNKNDD